MVEVELLNRLDNRRRDDEARESLVAGRHVESGRMLRRRRADYDACRARATPQQEALHRPKRRERC
jgi:hypothetical protein